VKSSTHQSENGEKRRKKPTEQRLQAHRARGLFYYAESYGGKLNAVELSFPFHFFIAAL
jgi:hypothetical protein